MGKTQRKGNKLDQEVKKRLARAVQQFPCLWKISHENYMKRDNVASCWDSISEELDVPVAECKSHWKALKDSLNYRVNVTKRGKSGDGILEDDDSGSDNEDQESKLQKTLEAWPMWECLKFLIESKLKRR